jgi:hypothetical protein
LINRYREKRESVRGWFRKEEYILIAKLNREKKREKNGRL